MPKLLIIRRYVFFVYSSDLNEKRMHVHVEGKKGRQRKSAKFWIEPEIESVSKGSFNEREITAINVLIEEHIELIRDQLINFKNGKRIKTIKL